MGSFERFKTKTHFNSLKRLVGVTALAALAVKLLTVALATAAGGGTPLDLLARVPASVADLGAALLVFEVLRTRRPLQLAARSAILVAVSPVLFVASGLHGDRIGVAVALLLLAIYLLVDRDAPLVAGITLAVASRVEPMALLAAPVAMAAIAAGADGPEPDDGRARRSRMVHFGGALAGALFAAWVPTLAWDWDSLAAAPSGPGRAGRPRPRLGAGPVARPGPGRVAARGGPAAGAGRGGGAGGDLGAAAAAPGLRRRRAGPARPPGPQPGVVAAGPGLAGRVRLPGGRPVGQHLRGRGRGHRGLDLDLVGERRALARRGRPGDHPDRRGGRPRPGHLGGARLLGVPGLAHGHGRGGGCGQPAEPRHPGGCGQPGEPRHPVGYAPPGGLDAGPGHTGAPGNGAVPGNGSAGNGSPLGNGAMGGDRAVPGSGAMAGDGSAAANGSPPAPVGAGNGSVPANGADPANEPYARERGH